MSRLLFLFCVFFYFYFFFMNVSTWSWIPHSLRLGGKNDPSLPFPNVMSHPTTGLLPVKLHAPTGLSTFRCGWGGGAFPSCFHLCCNIQLEAGVQPSACIFFFLSPLTGSNRGKKKMMLYLDTVVQRAVSLCFVFFNVFVIVAFARQSSLTLPPFLVRACAEILLPGLMIRPTKKVSWSHARKHTG